MAKNDPFAKFSINYPDHPKIADLSDSAFRAHVEMILYAARYETDGRIAKRIAKRWPKGALDELCSNDEMKPSLTQLEDGDFQLHSYGDHQTKKADIDARRAVNRENGRRGGLAKAKRIASDSVQHQAGENVAEVRSKKLEVITPISPQGTADEQRQFDAFWNAYPRRVAKKAARAKFTKALRDGVDPQTIIEAATDYAASVTDRTVDKIAHPTTWLNQGRWEDELPQETTVIDDRYKNPWKY